MSNEARQRPYAVVVTGDVTMDWNIACARPAHSAVANWSGDTVDTRVYWQRGGAALLADLVEAIARSVGKTGEPAFDLRQTAAPRQPVVPNDPRFHHGYTQWNLFPQVLGRAHDASPVWRMSEWLGLSMSLGDVATNDWARVENDTASAALVLLDDAALGFRDAPELWPQAIRSTERPWIILKTSRPVARGRLWEHLREHHADRLVLLTTIDDLRQSEVQISPRLSWERTAQDLVWELVYNPKINAVSGCAHVVISLGAAGAMLISRPQNDPANSAQSRFAGRLFFDPELVEGAWEQRHPGKMSGATTCMAAAIAGQLAMGPNLPNIGRGIQNGLAAIRALHKGGYGAESGSVTFPLKRIAETILSSPPTFAEAPVPDPGRNLAHTSHVTGQPNTRPSDWTILEDCYAGGLDSVAQQIVLKGVDHAIKNAPYARFGALVTVDRREIESFRSLSTLVGEYCSQTAQSRPLSIAVFGAPGSGKSFGVSQVASSLLPGRIQKLTFNLSQFETPAELFDAFHQARDVVLSGRIPLVFWDEFDTALKAQPLGWLRHFLSPMQDGAFQERQIAHPIGRAIFVFAGGTSETMSTFAKAADDPGFRAAKGPDFVSRLKGFVDIAGPNPRQGDRRFDRFYIIRRAILLRSMLLENAPQIFQSRNGVNEPTIDSGIMRALLEVPAYKHGARSMESIIASSVLTGKSRFDRSALPNEAQINLHVDGEQFAGLLHRLELSDDVVEKLAEAAYEVYRGSKSVQASAGGLPTPKYAEISEREKEANRQTVRELPTRLASVGYVIRPARSDERSSEFGDHDREALAEQEHEHWLKSMVASGWRHGTELRRDANLHPALLPWRDLPESERQKNRDLVQGMPLILAGAGYLMARTQQGNVGN